MQNPIDIVLHCSENKFQDELDNNKKITQRRPRTTSSQENRIRSPYTPRHFRSTPAQRRSPRRVHSRTHRSNSRRKEPDNQVNKKLNTTTGPKSSKQKNSGPTSKNGVPNDTRGDKERDYKQKSYKSDSPEFRRVTTQNGKNYLCQRAGPTNLTKPKSIVKKSHSGSKTTVHHQQKPLNAG